MNQPYSRISFVLACTCLFTALGFADTIKLKNGSVIKGKVTTYNEREFTIFLDLGTSSKRSNSRMVIAVEDIESIQFDTANDVSEGGAKPYTPPPNTTPTYREKEPATQSSAPPVMTPTPTGPQGKTPGNSEAPVAEKTVGVVAAADWTSTEIRVRKGQRIVITASGQVDLGNNHRTGPDGVNLNGGKKLLLDRPTGLLTAVIGDDNNVFIPIGSAAEFVAEREGILFLSVNEENLRDNVGSFTAKIKVLGK